MSTQNREFDSKRKLPNIDAAMVLQITLLEIFRDLYGMEACRDRNVGAQRRKLGPTASIEPVRINPVEMARDQARAMLGGMCRVCPKTRCDMKKWGIR